MLSVYIVLSSRSWASVLYLVHLSREEENCLLSDVCPWAKFRFPILFNSNIPVFTMRARLICIVVVFLHSLQKVTFISYGCLWIQDTSNGCKTNTVYLQFFRLTELYSLPSSFMARYCPVSVPLITTTPGLVALTLTIPIKSNAPRNLCLRVCIQGDEQTLCHSSYKLL